MIFSWKHYSIMIRLFLFFPYFAWFGRAGEQKNFPRLSHEEREHIESIKTKLNFEQWRHKGRNGRNILLTSIDIAALLPSGIECTQERLEGEFPAYRVQCSRGGTDGSSKAVIFNLWLFPSVDHAREGVLRRFLTVSAPMPYLKEQWEKQKVTYGDKSFGFGCWVTGNLVFDLTDGNEYEDLARIIFSAIDDRLNATPTNLSGTAADIGLKATKTGVESWIMAIPQSVSGRQLVIAYENATAELLDNNVVKLIKKRDDHQVKLRINMIEQGNYPRSFRVEIVGEQMPDGA